MLADDVARTCESLVGACFDNVEAFGHTRGAVSVGRVEVVRQARSLVVGEQNVLQVEVVARPLGLIQNSTRTARGLITNDGEVRQVGVVLVVDHDRARIVIGCVAEERRVRNDGVSKTESSVSAGHRGVVERICGTPRRRRLVAADRRVGDCLVDCLQGPDSAGSVQRTRTGIVANR